MLCTSSGRGGGVHSFTQRSAHTHMYVCIYIYIYMWLQPRLVGKKGPKSQKIPSFIIKMANKNRHKIVAVFVAFGVSSFSHFFCLFLLVSPYFLLFHDILEPHNSPPNEVTGLYIYAVELKTGPRFGVSSVKNWSKSSVKNWSNFFFAVFPQFYSVFWAFLETQIVQQCVKIVFLQNLGDVKNEVFEKKKLHFLFFPFLCWRPRNRKKKKKENGKGQKTL